MRYSNQFYQLYLLITTISTYLQSFGEEGRNAVEVRV
jgi:hypothetical protein